MLHHLEFSSFIALCMWVSISKCIDPVTSELVLCEGRGKCNGRWFFTASYGTKTRQTGWQMRAQDYVITVRFMRANVIIAFYDSRTGSGQLILYKGCGHKVVAVD